MTKSARNVVNFFLSQKTLKRMKVFVIFPLKHLMTDKFAKIHIIWVNNSKYRAYTHLWRSFAGEIKRKEGSLDKYGYIDVNKYNNKTTSL